MSLTPKRCKRRGRVSVKRRKRLIQWTGIVVRHIGVCSWGVGGWGWVGGWGGWLALLICKTARPMDSLSFSSSLFLYFLLLFILSHPLCSPNTLLHPFSTFSLLSPPSLLSLFLATHHLPAGSIYYSLATLNAGLARDKPDHLLYPEPANQHTSRLNPCSTGLCVCLTHEDYRRQWLRHNFRHSQYLLTKIYESFLPDFFKTRC